MRRGLCAEAATPVMVITDEDLPKIVHAWQENHRPELETSYLPGCSPELNPDEPWNQDLKSDALGRRRPASTPEMADDVRSCARSTQRRPEVVRSHFREEHVRNAA